jgi:hypothetical protein
MWARFCSDLAPSHPLALVLAQDPLTRRARDKPRGYPGDADLLDLIYGEAELPEGTTELGRAIYRSNVTSSPCRSVRERRYLLARYLDEAARRKPGACRVLSVACGHLREVSSCRAFGQGLIGELVAMDQDERSIARVERDLASTSATALTSRLFDALAPGGTLLLGNFCPETEDAGYMESFMDWRLLYRRDDDLQRLASTVPAARRRVFRDSLGNVAYLQLDQR